MKEQKARALLDQHFVVGLSPGKFAKLWRHVITCTGCKSYYDKLFGFDVGIDGGKAEVERIGGSVFWQVDREKTDSGGVLQWSWAMRAVMAAGVVALLMLVAWPLAHRGGAGGDFFERSASPGEQQPELLATCFRDVEGKIEDVQHLDGRVEPPTCTRGGRLAFAYRHTRPGDQLILFAQTGEEVTQLLSPLDLVATAGRQVLPGAFTIDFDAPAGEAKLIGVFGRSLDAIDAMRLKAAVKAGAGFQEAAGTTAVVRSLVYRLER